MSSPFVGEIRMFGGNFAPTGWAFCDGSAQSPDQASSLFELIGTTFGGDGSFTFNLPDLRGRVPIHRGQGPSISQHYAVGGWGGVESVTLATQQMPVHNHLMQASDASGQQPQPTNAYLAQTNPGFPYVAPFDTAASLNAGSVSGIGGSQPHENMAPSLAVSFIISMDGIFPSQA